MQNILVKDLQFPFIHTAVAFMLSTHWIYQDSDIIGLNLDVI